jgi:hypothetical protein
MKKALAAVLLFALVPSWARNKEPAPEILGIRLGMDDVRAHSRLTKLGHFKSEDEGQEAWTLQQDKRYQYVIVGFDRRCKVRYITVLARPQGQPVDYSTIGDLASAEHRETAGNVRYLWKPKRHPADFEFFVIARGQEPHRLTMYSVKRVSAIIENDGN